jgi:predicted metalloprotease with PDZ domain
MRIWESNSIDPFITTDLSTRDWMAFPIASTGNAYTEILNVEVQAGSCGLQVLKIAPESPLRRLRPLGSFAMQGLVECGDRIVAIDGIAISNVIDLEKLVSAGRSCEITIFDHRTRLTVSWQIHVREMLEAA